MVGYYLTTLTPEQENRVLVRKMKPYKLAWGDTIKSPGCLIGVVHGLDRTIMLKNEREWRDGAVSLDIDSWVGVQYNELCERFGTDRIGAAIRNRILANQARRALRGVRETVPA